MKTEAVHKQNAKGAIIRVIGDDIDLVTTSGSLIGAQLVGNEHVRDAGKKDKVFQLYTGSVNDEQYHQTFILVRFNVPAPSFRLYGLENVGGRPAFFALIVDLLDALEEKLTA